MSLHPPNLGQQHAPTAASRGRIVDVAVRHRRHRGYPVWWRRQAACIRYHESRGNWRINTGNGYYGAYQFLLSTWAAHLPPRAHWTSRPDLASPAQQTFVVWRTWIADGRSWREWGSASRCGLG